MPVLLTARERAHLKARAHSLEPIVQIGHEGVSDAVIREIDRVTGKGRTYITFDIDGLDAAYAMGTGVPEVGGFSVRDAQMMIRSLQGKHLVGGDICEVAPVFDPTGQTALNAANLLFEMLCVIADSRASRS